MRPGWLPTFTLRKHGGVAKGKSYIHTTALVDRGIYGLVRHPQYLSFLLVHLFFVLLVQHWAVTALGLAAIPLLYLIVQDEEQRNLERFGEAYRDYMARVPQLNLVAGLCRLLRRRSGG
ncbi:MAG: isoprenylcysteine carboxylmethyltransferase family protein [Chloroflexi bacterium]|nr:isoprenylcysteine carboxylmethyltransferase family protein [Chloroflexota bacterium]